MLGHQLVESWRDKHEVHASFRGAEPDYAKPRPERAHYGVGIADLTALVRRVRPAAVINAIGVVKQREQAKDAIVSIEVNSLLPHQLANICAEIGARLVQLSTDCVFSGRTGMYTEQDAADPGDLYGRSKLLGEVSGPGSITLRSSIIGLELSNKHSLVEWFLAQRGRIKGFRKAIYSGFTTLEMARIIEHVLLADPTRHGVYHVSSAPLDKLALLTKLRDLLKLDLELVPDDSFVCDRSLDSQRFRSEFEYVPPSWDAMLGELSSQIKERAR
jgi:dTDP-4-dehydrorhamnose reductase